MSKKRWLRIESRICIITCTDNVHGTLPCPHCTGHSGEMRLFDTLGRELYRLHMNNDEYTHIQREPTVSHAQHKGRES